MTQEFRSAEQGEVDAAVGAVFEEAGVVGEVVPGAMLEHEQSVGRQQSVLEDEVGDGGQCGQLVGWVGEDEVEGRSVGIWVLGPERPDVTEDVAADEGVRGSGASDFGDALSDEAGMVAVEFYADDLRAAA